ncbi:MAG: ATP-dependent RecD-like DNA helicase [Clostridia bacterium]|nr:ATP-dependent RecD-like DNA helicase [Clostridia bacterium]
MREELRENEERIKGTVTQVVYRSEESGYAVLRISCGKEEVTVVGIMPDAAEGESIDAIGEWMKHAEYGKQLKVKEYERQLPSGVDSMLRYLASGAISGIGPKTAVKIINRFGESTFEVMDKHPSWLADIPGISAKKANEIGECFAQRSGMRSLLLLCGDALSPAMAMRVYKKWGSAAAKLVEENPYRLASEFEGIGFSRADKLAASIGFSGNAGYRVQCGILHILDIAASSGGHCCLPPDVLEEQACRLLGADAATVRSERDALIAAGDVVAEGRTGLLFRRSVWRTEQSIASRLAELDKRCARVGVSDLEGLIKVIETERGISYAGLQRKAIISAVNSGVSVITGGPGTGKTTVILALIRIFEEMGQECALAAPTGRAAKRMSEATSHEAKTVHRLLEMDYQGEGADAKFLRDEKTPIEARVIIIDEASMLDVFLCDALLRAVRPGCRVIFIGDSDQLPPVGAGNVLWDIIDSGAFSTVKLTEIFRQAEKSLIVRNAHAVNRGELPVIDSTNEDFFFLPRENAQSTAATVADLCLRRLPKSYGDMGRRGVQVITPSRRGAAGTENLNLLLRDSLNPPAKGRTEKEIGGRIFREGDKVMQTRNNYDLEWRSGTRQGRGVFNGDIGVILRYDLSSGGAVVRFDDREVKYPFSDFEDLDHAYAITVHKSQGSEYPIVVMPLYPCAPMLQTRNMLYTAITRARTYVILVGSRDVLDTMVHNDSRAVRYSGLARRICELVPKE